MRKHEKKRLKRIRQQENLNRAIRHLEQHANKLGLQATGNTAEDFRNLAKLLSNKDLRALTNLERDNLDSDQAAIHDAIVSEFSDRTMKLEKE